MLRKKQIASYIDANFGKSPLDGGMYYDGTGRMKLIREYHEMRECESEVDAITWEDLEMDRIFLTVNHTNCFAGEQVLYDGLHRTDSLCDENEAEKYERQLESWMSHPKERLQVEEKLYEIGKFEKLEAGQFMVSSSDASVVGGMSVWNDRVAKSSVRRGTYGCHYDQSDDLSAHQEPVRSVFLRVGVSEKTV